MHISTHLNALEETSVALKSTTKKKMINMAKVLNLKMIFALSCTFWIQNDRLESETGVISAFKCYQHVIVPPVSVSWAPGYIFR